jgi:hypothetical protein
LEKSLSELNIFIELIVILYADDTVILADSVEGMQNALDIFKLIVNFVNPITFKNQTKI